MRARLAFLAALAPIGLIAWTWGDPVSSPRASAAVKAHGTTISRHEPIALGEALPDEAPAHLALSLKLADDDGLSQLIADQQNPSSPRYRAFLTPAEFGARFGLPEATYARVVAWLQGEGFSVTTYPNRLFVEARGTVAGARGLLGVQLRRATARGVTFRSYGERMSLPDDIAPLIEKVGGLDTRPRLHHRIELTPYQEPAQNALGAVDMRALYGMPSGAGASGLTLAILATQEGTADSKGNPGAPFIPPSVTAINTYLTTIASATVTYNPIVMSNTDDDFDEPGSNGEYQLDVEMQSVGAPTAKDIDLVLSPSSVVFQTGAQYIVNSLSSAVAVSTSIGLCESEEVEDDGGAATPGTDAYIFRTAVKQGVAEGQMWFAAAGDSGADDCNDDDSDTKNGFKGGNATVDFPCSVPEIVCMGGTQLRDAGVWNTQGDLMAWQPEVVWNEGDAGGAGGGGQSMLYTKPTWQTGVGPMATDGARDVPDLALAAAVYNPGVAIYDCGSGQDSTCDGNTSGAGQMDINGGTSIASPLAAGFFANLSGQLGCRLGDIHPSLYSLGAAQQSGGAAPFHDMTSGDNSFPDPKNKVITGFTAAAGYDLASGWGSIDLVKLVEAWPACADGGVPTHPDGGEPVVEDGGQPGTGDDDGSPGTPGSDADGGGPVTTPTNPDGGPPGNGATGSGGGSSGCGCAQVGASRSSAPLGFLAAAIGLVAARRRRRRTG